jgi:hypothetical protein
VIVDVERGNERLRQAEKKGYRKDNDGGERRAAVSIHGARRGGSLPGKMKRAESGGRGNGRKKGLGGGVTLDV